MTDIDLTGARPDRVVAVEEFGADHVMWATDYPYRQPGDAKEFIGRLGLTEEEAEKVGHLNAERLFRLV